jgi:YYY domain-containing protein
LMIVAALLAYLWGFELVLLLVPLVVGCCWYILKAQSKTENRFVLLLILMGALIALLCEIFYVNDAYSDPWERYNTVMKVYLQVWVLLAIASAYGVFWVRRKLGRRLRIAWTVLLLVFVVASAIQPIGLTVGWASGQRDLFGENRGTLDGLAYVEERDPGAYEAILWLNENVDGSPVILEAPGGAYEFTSVVSTMTGLPTVVGWVTHEVMWRGGWDMVAGRDTDVDTIYQTTDEAEAGALLDKYDVEYIYVGAQERDRYAEEGLEKFASSPQRYELVFEDDGARVYHVVPK